MRSLLGVAARNLGRRPGRYATLGSAIAIGCAVLTASSGAVGGMRASLMNKAAVYYGGDFSVHGIREDGLEMIRDAASLVRTIESAGGLAASPRIVDRSGQAFLFFAGESIQLKQVTGVDWESEGKTFGALSFSSGGVGDAGEDGIIVSEPMAQALGARVGDDVLIMSSTIEGQRNTSTAMLKGVFKDSSFLGAGTAYVGIGFLRSLIRYPEGAATEIRVSFTGPRRQASEVQAALELSLPMFPLKADRAELFAEQRRGGWVGEKYAMLTLAAHVRQIAEVADFLQATLVAVGAVLLGIVVLGTVNTYRVIARERMREIGAMRAIGMQRRDVAKLFLAEAGLLAAAGTATGLALGIGALCLLAAAPLDRLSGFDVFLSQGRLAWFLSPPILSGIVLTMLATCLLASAVPAMGAARVEPATACAME
jgi:putative ABC transport system permease protein